VITFRHIFTTTTTMANNALDLLDATIAELEARLHLKPGQVLAQLPPEKTNSATQQGATNAKLKAAAPLAAGDEIPDICKLEFKVGVITKVWVHETADKLYCEEIDIGEESPRQIASGLRSHFTLDEMLGQRLLVVSNLKAKNLVGFKSHGMVLCAAKPDVNGTSEHVEFVEPPHDAAIGEVVTFQGLPPPQPLAPSQVEKKKVFAACCPGMATTDDCVAVWNGHAFLTSAGPCKTRTIANGVLR
jgi:aminoacyl tRNA synthase complex-interacting multifunctional protein 1